MAEVASKVEAGKKVELVKPEKPDEEAYKAALKKAEKEHADSMARFVSSHRPRQSVFCAHCCCLSAACMDSS
jgi:hypothetical protein